MMRKANVVACDMAVLASAIGAALAVVSEMPFADAKGRRIAEMDHAHATLTLAHAEAVRMVEKINDLRTDTPAL